MYTEYVSEQGAKAVIGNVEASILPQEIGPWARVGKASQLTYAETTIIDRDGFVLREPSDS